MSLLSACVGCHWFQRTAKAVIFEIREYFVMPLTRAKLERQLQAANADLATYAKTLQESGLKEADFKRNTKWRSLNAEIRTVRKRLAAVTTVEANNAAVEQHKSERLAAAE